MVALVMGIVVVLSTVAVQKAFESQRRTSVSGNDLDNTGAYVLSQLDGMLRAAGSGFTQSYQQTYGCPLTVAQGTNTLVPPPALPAPFDNVLPSLPGALIRVAPVLILPANTAPAYLSSGDGSSDVLIIMSGAGYAANLPTIFTGVPGAHLLTVESTTSFQPNDLVLLMDAANQSGPAPCLLSQVAGSFVNRSGESELPLGAPTTGTSFYASAPLSPASFSVAGAVVAIGNPLKGNFPGLALVGVGSGSQLYSYDLLQFAGMATATPMGDGVMELHARYLMQKDQDNGYVGVDPAATADYAPAALMAGTLDAGARLRNIKAVRIGLILKSPLLEQPTAAGHVATAPLVLFSTLNDVNKQPLTYTRVLSSANCDVAAKTANAACERDYRYRTLELTIPLRNLLY